MALCAVINPVSYSASSSTLGWEEWTIALTLPPTCCPYWVILKSRKTNKFYFSYLFIFTLFYNIFFIHIFTHKRARLELVKYFRIKYSSLKSDEKIRTWYYDIYFKYLFSKTVEDLFVFFLLRVTRFLCQIISNDF